MGEVYLVGGVRTPVGRFGGALAAVRPDDLAALVVSEVVNRTGVPSEALSDVILGCANQAGEDNRNIARMAALLAGFPNAIPGFTVNRLCASGLQAIASGWQCIVSGSGEVVVAGGVESMSRSPWVMARPTKAWTGPTEVVDSSLGWRFVNPRMRECAGEDATLSLGLATEKLARMSGITRERADVFAALSHQRAVESWDEGLFDDSIIPVETGEGILDRDETLRPETTVEALAKLRPSFDAAGVVTAGNASPLSDGASAMVVASEEAVVRHGLKPRAKIVGYAVAGVDPSLFGLGPVPAIRLLLSRHNLHLNDIDEIEINEAFSAQVLACIDELQLEVDRVNADGGAIALGHPLGSSGSRLMLTLVNRLERKQGRYGIASLCIGVGQGAAMLVERVA